MHATLQDAHAAAETSPFMHAVVTQTSTLNQRMPQEQCLIKIYNYS
jgi:hypothetical protein